MILRDAAIADVPLLEEWLNRPHVMKAIGAVDTPEWDFREAIALACIQPLIAELDGCPIGYVEILDAANDPDQYWGPVSSDIRALDIWIGDEANTGKGFGRCMMTAAIEKCFSEPEVDKILIDPLVNNPRAIRFYERLGFLFVEERTFDGIECAVMELTRARWAAH